MDKPVSDKPVSTEDFMRNIELILMPKIKEEMLGIKLGKVISVSGKIANIQIDGDKKATPVHRFCAASAGQRALVLTKKTQYYLIGVQ